MHPDYAPLYEALLRDIQESRDSATTEREYVETGFWITVDYGKRLQSQVMASGFTNIGEETCFFREVKPAFYHWSEFFVMLSEALLSVPSCPKLATAFWGEEQLRSKRFERRHQGFLHYFQTGDDALDELYFTRAEARRNPVTGLAAPYDDDPHFHSSHDRVLRRYLALRRYRDYCEQQLARLMSS